MSTPQTHHLARTAAKLETLAQELRRAASLLDLQAHNRKAHDTEMAEVKRLARLVAKKAGYSARKISTEISDAPLHLREFVEYHAMITCRDMIAQRRAERDHQIARLSRQGVTHAEIARQFDLTPRTITRVVRDARKA